MRGSLVGIFVVVGVMLVVVVVMALLVERFTTWADEEVLQRDERDISLGPSDWGRARW